MTSELATLSAKLDLVLSRLDEINRTGKPGMTQAEFGRLIKKHPRTINRWVSSKKLRKEKGLIPYSEARKFLS